MQILIGHRRGWDEPTVTSLLGSWTYVAIGQLISLFSTGASIILAYLNEKNRPYSAQDVFSNLQKQHGLGKTVRVTITYSDLCVPPTV